MAATRAVFMGSDAFSIPILSALLERGGALEAPVAVVGVVTQPDRPAGRGRSMTANAVKVLAQAHGVPISQPERLRKPEAIEEVLNLMPDVIVVAAFGQILPGALVEAPRYKSLNLHPSMLPRLRGPSPIESAILSGEAETGTTLIRMTEAMDAGPIVDQERTPIMDGETAGELAIRLSEMSAELLLNDLPRWIGGDIRPRDQDDSRATYTQRIRKGDGNLDWSKPSELLAREVRAFEPWPGAYTFWSGGRLRVRRAHWADGAIPIGLVEGLRDGALAIGTGNGVLLADEVQLEGRRSMAAAELIAGNAGLIGARLSRDP